MTRSTLVSSNNLKSAMESESSSQIAIADLEQLIRTAGRTRRDLMFLDQDIRRIRADRKEIIYLLDFSELHSFLWPEASNSQYKVLCRFLLTQSRFNFALPPGATLELLHKLYVSAQEQRVRRSSVEETFSNPFVQAFASAYSKALDDPAAARSALADTRMAEVFSMLEHWRRSDDSITRLRVLHKKGKLQSLASIVDVSEVSPDVEVLHLADSMLSALRPSHDSIVNYVDAHNYALTYALTNRYYEQGFLFLFVTASPIPYRVFDQLKWKEDPLWGVEPIHTSLVRHPIQLLYHHWIEEASTDARRLIAEASSSLQHLQESWRNIAAFKQYKQEEPRYFSPRPVRLPANKKYRKNVAKFSVFYHAVLRPLAELTASDVALENNRRRRVGVDTYASSSYQFIGGGHAIDDSHDPAGGQSQEVPISYGYRSLIALFDRLLTLTEREMRWAKGLVAGFRSTDLIDIDRHSLVVPRSRLELKVEENATLRCREYTVFVDGPQIASHPRGSPVAFCADRYADYTSFWWRTNIDFGVFIKAVRLFSQSAAEWVLKNRDAFPNVNKRRMHTGVYFYLSDDVRQYDLQPDQELEAGWLLRLCDPSLRLRFVRLGLEHGDLCYDFEPISGFPQRAGLVTHLPCVDPIADLIKWTSSKPLKIEAVRGSVKEIFGV